MRIRRRQPPAPRQRLRHSDAPPPAAFSYHARRSEHDINTGRQLDRESLKAHGRRLKNFWRNRYGLAVSLLVAIACLAGLASLSSSAKVVPVGDEADRVALQPLSVYQAAAHKLLSESVWNRTKLTVDTKRLSDQLAAQYPEIASASVSLPLITHKPVIYIQPAQPALIVATKHGTFVVDTTGKVLIMEDNVSSDAVLQLPRVIDQSNLSAAVGHQLLSTDNVNFIRAVSAELAAKQFSVTSMTLPAGSSELDVALKGQPFFVKFNLASQTARQQAGTFLATQSQLARQHITPGQYVDVRVEGRAYYR